jgi:hypothetical protein
MSAVIADTHALLWYLNNSADSVGGHVSELMLSSSSTLA